MNAKHSGSWPSPGPLETASFPEQLTARVVTPGAQPRVHGYDVESDLMHNYSPSAVAYLALTGELPTPEVELALDAILVFASPVSVATAPAHAAVLARLCGCESTSVLSAAAIALAEQAKHVFTIYEAVLAWLRTTAAEIPQEFRAPNRDDVEASRRLGAVLRSAGLGADALEQGVTREVAIIVGLHACGIRTRAQCEVLLVWARLPLAMAEALAEHATNFRHYPINLPQYFYEE